MKIRKPILSEKLEETEDLTALLMQSKLHDESIVCRRICGASLSEERIGPLDFENVIFENCRFSGCSFRKISFTDCLFKTCDFSNGKFENCRFKRCELSSVKAVGADFSESDLYDISLGDGNFRYASFDSVRLEGVSVGQSDFSEAALTACKMKAIFLSEVKFIRSNFFRTPLKGIDFTESVLEAPVVSDEGKELAGATVSLYQAADLAKLLGVIVK